MLVFNTFQLVALAYASALFPRVLVAMGAPSVLNFVHYLVVPLVFLLFIKLSKIYFSGTMLRSLGVFSFAVFISAIWAGAGVVNFFLQLLIFIEPLLLLFVMTNLYWSSRNIRNFRYCFSVIIAINVLFTFVQYFLLGLAGDDVRGIFIGMGAGHHVSAAVTGAAVIYFFCHYRQRGIFLKIGFFSIAASSIVMTDAKQVLAVYLVSIVFFIVLKSATLKDVMAYFMGFFVLSGITYIGAITIFPALGIWMVPELITLGVMQKFSVLSVFWSVYESPVNFFVGFGPGHTVSRLAILMPAYSGMFQDLGATTHFLTDLVFSAQQSHWISNSVTGSSIWSLTFSWAGLFGDLGLFGMLSYLYCWYVVWKFICITDAQKFCLVSMGIFGVVFSWMEEPGFMLTIAVVVGLLWQEHKRAL